MTTGPTNNDVNNASNLVGLMQEMQGIGENISRHFSSTHSSTSQLVTAVTTLNERLSETNNLMSNASQSALGMVNNLDKAADKLNDQKSALNSLMSGLDKAGQKQEGWLKRNLKIFAGQKDLFSSMGALTKSWFKPVGELFDKITNSKVWKVGEYLFNTLKRVYGMVSNVIKIVGHLATGALTAIKKVSELMIGVPLKISEVVSEMGGTFRKETVEEFGQLAEDIKEKINATSSLGKSFNNSLKEAQENLIKFYDLENEFTRQFGYGAAGAKKMLSESQEIIAGLGVNLNFFGSILGKNERSRLHLVKLQKALNMTAEDTENIGIIARSTGRGFMSLGIDIYNSIDRSAKKFSLDGKTISSTVFKLRGDFIEFGHMTTDAISNTVAELTQMGVQAEDISGVFKKFDTFESAAQSAAMLAQTFGMNVDALKLIQAESPAEIFHELTSAMYNTGRSFSDLNRHEKALMAQHTGLSGKTLQMVMNYTEMGMRYEDAIAKAEEQDPVTKQTAALDKMTKSIKELNKILSFKSPFAAFADGFKKTMLQSTGLRNSMESLNEKYQSFYTEGLRINKDILKKAAMPIMKIVDSIGQILGGPKLKKIMENLVTNVSNFVHDIFEGNIEKARQSIRSIFDPNNFNNNVGFISDLMKLGGGIIGKIAKGMFVVVDEISKVLTSGINKFIETDPSKIGGKKWFAGLLKKFFNLESEDQASIIEPALKSVGELLVALPKLLKPLQTPLFNFFGSIASYFANTIKRTLLPSFYRMIADIQDSLPFKFLGSGNLMRAKASRLESDVKNKSEAKKIKDAYASGKISKQKYISQVADFNKRRRNENMQYNKATAPDAFIPTSALVYFGGKGLQKGTGAIMRKVAPNFMAKRAARLAQRVPFSKILELASTPAGRNRLIRVLARKIGRQGAKKIVAKLALKAVGSMIPGLGLVSLGLLAKDVYDIYNMFSHMPAVDENEGIIDPEGKINKSTTTIKPKLATSVSPMRPRSINAKIPELKVQGQNELVEGQKRANALMAKIASKDQNINIQVNVDSDGTVKSVINKLTDPTSPGITIASSALRDSSFANTGEV